MEQSDLLKQMATANRKKMMQRLQKELHMSKMNKDRITATWRKINRRNKVEYLHKEIEVCIG
jgi:hypothetical protein